MRDNSYKMLQRKIYSDPGERCVQVKLDGCFNRNAKKGNYKKNTLAQADKYKKLPLISSSRKKNSKPKVRASSRKIIKCKDKERQGRENDKVDSGCSSPSEKSLFETAFQNSDRNCSVQGRR